MEEQSLCIQLKVALPYLGGSNPAWGMFVNGIVIDPLCIYQSLPCSYISRAAPSMEAHHRVSGPNTGSNSGFLIKMTNFIM